MLDLRSCTSGFLAIVLISFCVPGASGRAPSRIIGGTDAEPGEFPWQVSVRAYDKHLCGGTIIGKRHVLTAAHCIVGVTEAPYSEMTIVTGSYTQRPGTGRAYRVNDAVVHGQYVPRSERNAVRNDIAVISLRKEMEENEFQRPISLSTGEIPNGAVGTVTGFGWTNFQERKSVDALQKLNVTLMNGGLCLERGIRVQKSQICGVNAVGQGTCRGDSGGPLVYDGVIVGVVSTAMHPCGFGIPDVYTKVYHYLDFIKQVTAVAR